MSSIIVKIPEYHETSDRKSFAIMVAEMEFWKREAERLRNELVNIPRAIKEWGYVEITLRGETITLHEKPEDISHD